MTDKTRLTAEQIKEVVGASDEYWATSKLFIIGIARAIEDACAASHAQEVKRLREALERLCTHRRRTSVEINADWDFARAALQGDK